MTTTFQVEIDWDHNGTWTDESAYVQRVQVRSGFAEPGDPVADVGRCVLTLDNATRRYSPGNAQGSLYGKLLPRRAVRVRATEGVQSWTLFRGFIERIAPDAGAWGAGTVQIVCVDGIALLDRQRTSVPHAASKAVDDAVSELVSAVYTPPATAYDDNGDAVTHYGRAWQPEQTTVLHALRDVVRAVYGRFYVARDGTPTFLTRDRLQNPATAAVLDIGEVPPTAYTDRILAAQPGHLVAYWPLNESAGTVAHDLADSGYHGTAYGVTWGSPGISGTDSAALFDGVNDYIALPEAVDSAVTLNAGTALLWFRVDAGVWTDGGEDWAVNFGHLSVRKLATGNTLFFKAANKAATLGGSSDTDWVCIAVTWDVAADRLTVWKNGSRVIDTSGLSAPGVGAYSNIGARSVSLAFWNGLLAHVALWDVVLGDAQIAALAEM